MFNQTELNKLKASKSSIRKVLERKNTGMNMSVTYPKYYTYIKGMNDTKTVDESGIKDYVEDRVYSLTLTVKKIRPYAFRNYTCLRQLYLNSSEIVTLENINAFYGCDTQIVVPSNLLAQYKANSEWSKIKDRIVAYSSLTADEMYLLQHIEVQTVSWLQSKKVSEINKDFRV